MHCEIFIFSVLVLFNACYFVKSGFAKTNNRPIIGILAQKTKIPGADTEIQATYVKFLESAGARVVPVRTEEPDSYYEKLFSHINGVLFPGGAVSIQVGAFAEAARQIYDLAIKANDKGDYFPLWGTCLGFQLLTNLTAHMNLLRPTDSEDLTLPLELRNYKSSRMLQNLPEDIFKIITEQAVTFNNHHWGLWLKVFEQTKSLKDFYRVLSTNKDRKSVTFVSTIEAFKYPFYGTQWHPETNSFRWNPKENIDHSFDAIEMSQYFGNFFVNEARKSNHSFPRSKEESTDMIENSKRAYLDDGTYRLVYLFNKTN